MIKGLKKWRLFALLTALTVFLSGCGEEYLSTLTPAGQTGREQFNMLILSSAVMFLVIIVVVIIYVLAIVKFRRSKRGEDFIPEQVEGNHKLELIWTTIPIILLLILAVPTIYYTYKQADVAEAGMKDEDGNVQNVVVDVTANLYWWEFTYPDLGITTAQELVVPTGEKVYFNLIASDVKHSFWIPAIGGKLDTNVENVNKFYLTFDKESEGLKDGTFYGKCAELCGPSHALMDFKVVSLDKPEFEEWVAAMQATETAATPADATAQQGQEIFNQSCIACHATSGVGEGGAIGPNLTTFGDRNRVAGFLPHDKENLINWISDPQKYKPGNTMPKIPLTDEELDALAEYIMGLSVEQ